MNAVNWQERAEKAEGELAELQAALVKLRGQKPVAWMDAEGDTYKEEPPENWCPPYVPLYTAANPAAILALIAEIDSLRDQVNGLTGSLDRAETALQNLMSYLSVNGCWAEVDADEAEKRIRDGIDMLVRPAVERAELAEAQLKELANQEPLTWGTSGELMDILKTPIYARPVSAPAVPEEWREVMADMLANDGADGGRYDANKWLSARDKARALLQSAEVTNAAADRLIQEMLK